MSNKQLPPELVEKMMPYSNSFNGGPWHNANQCAQIAVDYADEQLKDILYKDELELVIRTLSERATLIDFENYDSDEFENPKAHSSWLYTCSDKLKQLLKTHEDGKE